MQIDMNSISQKIKSYTNSSEGRKEIKQSMSKSEMMSVAEKLVDMIKTYLPPSIQNNVEIICNNPIETSNGWQVEINFDAESIFRNSLLNDGDSGYGVDNIVALLNNGYHARKSVYGYWDTAGKDIWSRQDREALGFMQNAINAFNNDIGSKYGCTAELSDKYEY